MVIHCVIIEYYLTQTIVRFHHTVFNIPSQNVIQQSKTIHHLFHYDLPKSTGFIQSACFGGILHTPQSVDFMSVLCNRAQFILTPIPQWGAADAEIKVPSDEDTELKRSPFKPWSRSVYSHTCYTYCQGFLSCLCLHFRSIHLHFFQNLSRFFPVLAVANTWFLCRPAE